MLDSVDYSTDELTIARLAVELGAARASASLSAAEARVITLAQRHPTPSATRVSEVIEEIRLGGDPLGEALYASRPKLTRRTMGAVYTPPEIVTPMVDWVTAQSPDRVVDAGCGSGRYAIAVARRAPEVHVIGVDTDPVATLIARANLHTIGATHAEVVNDSFNSLVLPEVDGRTAFIGNPPYVRHHRLSPDVKRWLQSVAARWDVTASMRAGLYVYFFVGTRVLGKPGDVGCYVTAAEWLDVAYGALVRSLLLDGLGATSIDVVHPATRAYKSVDSTAVITCFEIGQTPRAIRVREIDRLEELKSVASGKEVSVDVFAAAPRWTPILRPRVRQPRVDRLRVRLGDVVRIRRGIATGANDYFVLSQREALDLDLMDWCVPVVSRAAEIFEARPAVSTPTLKVLLFVARGVSRRANPALHSYLCRGEHDTRDASRVKDRYLCRSRNPWWSVEQPPPAPIIATYMGRRPPAFAFNPDGVAVLNIGHYIWPRYSETDSERLVRELNAVSEDLVGQGRTYQGGLEKFEPSELASVEVDLPLDVLPPSVVAQATARP